MAIGYGLAVYLGNGRHPVQITLGRSRKTKAAVATPLEKTSEQVPVETQSTPDIEAETPTEQAKVTPTPEQVPQLDVKDLMPDAGSTLMTEESNEATAPESAESEPTESEPAKPEPTATDKPVGNLAEATPEETADEPVVEAPITEEAVAKDAKNQEKAEEEEVVEKKVDDLESLSQQLQSAMAESGDEQEDKEQQAMAEEPTVETEQANDLPDAETLAGIDSFREQLAKM